jgi:replicative DNA helicase
MMLYREDYYDRDTPEIKGLAEVIIGKQRNGPTGTVKVRWRPEFGLFENNIEQNLGPTPQPPGGGNSRPAAPIAQFPPQGGKPRNFAPGV